MLSVLLVSDQPVLIQGFESVLAGNGLGVAAGLSSGYQPAPDLVLLDVTSNPALAHMREVHQRAPCSPMVLWADHLPLETVFKALEYGVRGIVRRNSQPVQLVDSLRRVAAGEMQIGFGAAGGSLPLRPEISLTPREREIIARLRTGIRNKQIALEMGITEGTVKIYLFRLFQKLGVRNRFELARTGLA